MPFGECRVAPRECDIAELAGEAVSESILPLGNVSSPASSVSLDALPVGAPADADTAAELSATLRQLTACGNAAWADLENDARARANDQVLSLYSEDYFRRNAEASIADAPPPENRTEALLRQAGLGVARTVSVSYGTLPLGPGAPMPIIQDVRALPDGRVIAVVRPQWDGLLVIELTRDPDTRRLLVDEFANVVEDPGTPTPQ